MMSFIQSGNETKIDGISIDEKFMACMVVSYLYQHNS